MMFEPQDLDHPGSKRAALQQSLEGLELNLRELTVFPDHLIELEHSGLVTVHSKERSGGEDGTREDTPHEPCEHGEQKHGKDSPAMADDRPPVHQRRGLRILPFRANVSQIAPVRKDWSCHERSDRRPAQNPFAIPSAPLKKSRNPKANA